MSRPMGQDSQAREEARIQTASSQVLSLKMAGMDITSLKQWTLPIPALMYAFGARRF